MIIKTLVENTSISENLNSEHGLCLYIETIKHKILFDLGASALFIDKAKIYLNQKAFHKHYSNTANGEKAYIGLDEGLLPTDRFVFVRDHLIIDDELQLFSNIKGKKLIAPGNQNLLMELMTSIVQDDFSHEQNLIINEGCTTLLVAGCCHNGIVNIIDHFTTKMNGSLSHVIGGFHLSNPSSSKCEDSSLINQIGVFLKNTDSTYYTCHCTRIEPYQKLKEIMGEKIHYLATGSQFII